MLPPVPNTVVPLRSFAFRFGLFTDPPTENTVLVCRLAFPFLTWQVFPFCVKTWDTSFVFPVLFFVGGVALFDSRPAQPFSPRLSPKTERPRDCFPRRGTSVSPPDNRQGVPPPTLTTPYGQPARTSTPSTSFLPELPPVCTAGPSLAPGLFNPVEPLFFSCPPTLFGGFNFPLSVSNASHFPPSSYLQFCCSHSSSAS